MTWRAVIPEYMAIRWPSIRRYNGFSAFFCQISPEFRRWTPKQNQFTRNHSKLNLTRRDQTKDLISGAGLHHKTCNWLDCRTCDLIGHFPQIPKKVYVFICLSCYFAHDHMTHLQNWLTRTTNQQMEYFVIRSVASDSLKSPTPSHTIIVYFLWNFWVTLLYF